MVTIRQCGFETGGIQFRYYQPVAGARTKCLSCPTGLAVDNITPTACTSETLTVWLNAAQTTRAALDPEHMTARCNIELFVMLLLREGACSRSIPGSVHACAATAACVHCWQHSSTPTHVPLYIWYCASVLFVEAAPGYYLVNKQASTLEALPCPSLSSDNRPINSLENCIQCSMTSTMSNPLCGKWAYAVNAILVSDLYGCSECLRLQKITPHVESRQSFGASP